MYPSTRKTPLNCGSHPDPESRYGALINCAIPLIVWNATVRTYFTMSVKPMILNLFVLFPLLQSSNNPVSPCVKKLQNSLKNYFNRVISQFNVSMKYALSFHTLETANTHLSVTITDMKTQSTLIGVKNTVFHHNVIHLTC